jgi:hypothetical protein
MASRKLRHYFEAFKVRVTSYRGLGELFRNPEASVRIAKWAAELLSVKIMKFRNQAYTPIRPLDPFNG